MDRMIRAFALRSRTMMAPKWQLEDSMSSAHRADKLSAPRQRVCLRCTAQMHKPARDRQAVEACARYDAQRLQLYR